MIARKSTLIMATEVVNATLAFVALFFIARYMGPGDYGIIGFAMLLLESSGTGGRVTFDGTLGMFKRSYHHFVKIGLLSLGFAQLVR